MDEAIDAVASHIPFGRFDSSNLLDALRSLPVRVEVLDSPLCLNMSELLPASGDGLPVGAFSPRTSGKGSEVCIRDSSAGFDSGSNVCCLSIALMYEDSARKDDVGVVH
jgi:hypothetical protein